MQNPDPAVRQSSQSLVVGLSPSSKGIVVSPGTGDLVKLEKAHRKQASNRCSLREYLAKATKCLPEALVIGEVPA